MHPRAGPLLALLAALTLTPAQVTAAPAVPSPAPPAGCTFVDLMPAFWQAAAAPGDGVAALESFIAAHAEVYRPELVSLPAGPERAALLSRSREEALAHRQEILAAGDWLAASAPGLMRDFAGTFPDFRCDFPFYVAPSFGRLDATASLVAGDHRIVFAPDVIARFHRLAELRVLVDHETFHIHHHQQTGEFGADGAPVPIIFAALWGEGLATYASWRMNPDLGLEVAMLQPGIPAGAAPHLARIARDLRAHLDERDADTFRHYFQSGGEPPGLPPRAGYYVGVLLAQSLARRYPLAELAGLHGTMLHDEVARGLDALAAEPSGLAP